MTGSRSEEDGQVRSCRFSATSTNVELNFYIGIGPRSEHNLVAASQISAKLAMIKLATVLDSVQILILKVEHHQA